MPNPSRLTGAGLAFALIVCAGIYAPGLSGGFLFDDFPNLLDNLALRQAQEPSGLWRAATSVAAGPTRRPLTMLSFAVQVRETGFNPWPMKLVNLLIHLANGAVVFLLVRRLAQRVTGGWTFGPEGLALAVTTAWLLAPVNLSSVLYVVQRMEILSTLFTLAGVWIYTLGRERLLAGDRRGLVWCWTSLIAATGLGTLAKESAVLTPLYALVVEVVVYRFRTTDGRCQKHLLALYTLLLAVPGVLGLMWFAPGLLSGQAYLGRPFNLAQRLWTEGRVLWSYLTWILFPHPSALGFYHDDYPLSSNWLHPWTTLPAAVGIGVLAWLGFYLNRRLPLVSLGILWFLAGHALTATVIPLELVFEHRNYCPAVGLLLVALAGGLDARLPLAAVRSLFALAWIALFGFQTAQSAVTWGNPLMLAQTTASYHPSSPRANYELGLTLTRFSPANPQWFEQGMAAIKKAATLPGAGLLPDHALIFLSSRYGLAIEETWWQRIRDRARKRILSNEDINALYSLIRCRIDGPCAFPPERLGEVLQAAVETHPENGDLITLYANYAANLARNFPLALELMQQAVTLQPRNVQYWVNLARLQIALRQKAARFSLERIAELSPGSSPFQELTAFFYTHFGRPWRPPHAS